jgi:hypothetical protein
LLFAVALILYLHDQATRLFANEVLFYRSGRGRWTAKPADRYPEFGRRYLALVRPWRPDTTTIRATWPRLAHSGANRDRTLQVAVSGIEDRLRFLRYQSVPLLLTLFVGLPFAHLLYGSAALVVGILLAYLQVLVMLASLLARRAGLGLPWRSLGFVLFESLICIPYAINLYRKVADRLVPADADPIDLAAALLDAADSTVIRRDLLHSVERRMSLADGANQGRLAQYRERLLEQNAA